MARGRKKQYEREVVLTKAMEVFWQKGYEGSHLQELVEQTGLNRFSLYSEFGGKENLFYEAFKLYLTQAQETYQKHLAKDRPALENIYTYFRGITFGDDYHGCMLVNTLNNQHAVPPAGFSLATDFVQELRGHYLNNLLAGIDDGQIHPDSPIGDWANSLLSFDLGLSVAGVVLAGMHPGTLAAQNLKALIESTAK